MHFHFLISYRYRYRIDTVSYSTPFLYSQEEISLTLAQFQGAIPIPFLSCTSDTVCPGRHEISILKILFHCNDKLIKKITLAVKCLLHCILQFLVVQCSRRTQSQAAREGASCVFLPKQDDLLMSLSRDGVPAPWICSKIPDSKRGLKWEAETPLCA